MYQKKHIIITAVCTAVLVWAFCCGYFIALRPYTSGDPVARARDIITKHYVNELTDEQKKNMEDLSIEGMVYALGDPYSRYLNAEALESFQEEHAESYRGIGIAITFDAEAGTMTVTSVYQDSPAEEAGILPGDRIVQVDETVVSAKTYDAILAYIKSGEHETLSVRIARDGKEQVLSVRCEEIREQTVSYKMFGSGLGYVRISQFIVSTEADFAAAIEALTKQGLRGLVIDLRSNPGGYAQTVISMTDSLLPEGIIAYLEDNHGKREYFYSDDTSLDVPMAVLINRGTASAAELMAGSLKAHGLAMVIGEKSFGKAVGQSLFPLSQTTALQLTNARYFTPNGECIDGVGIQPDESVALDEALWGQLGSLEPEEDAQLAKSLELLIGQTVQ
ncbi:MAG: S41 family peptidase [Ruminococcaceae bacterium]|nr:S41 family peptidase [Oscillospiraceae bacterium]